MRHVPQVTLRQFAYFLVVAASGGIRRAAEPVDKRFYGRRDLRPDDGGRIGL